MEAKRRFLKRFDFKPRRLGGVLLAFVAIGLLGAVGWFLRLKYAAPPPLAQLLPADSTIFFAELRTNEEENSAAEQIAEIFAEVPSSELFDLDSLGFTAIGDFLDLLGERAGVAFLGEQLDPQRFLLALDVADREVALAFLKNQALAGETLAEEHYLHQKIYSFPRSQPFAFLFWQNDLLVASHAEDLRAVATVIHDRSRSLRNAEGYRAVIAKLNPRAAGFAYFSERFLKEISAGKLDGLRSAVATPLIDLWRSGGVEIAARDGGLALDTRLILKNEYARAPFFAAVPKLNPAPLKLLGEETQIFCAGRDARGQLGKFLTASEPDNPSLALLLTGSARQLTREWLGGEIDFAAELAPFFEEEGVVGLTRSGGLFGIFGGTAEELFGKLSEQLAKSDGKLAAGEHALVLPDGSFGQELVADPNRVLRDSDLYAGYTVSRLRFPRYEIHSAVLGDWLAVASERTTLEAIINRFVAEEDGLAPLVATSGIAGNVFYTRLDTPQNPFLKPFRYALGGIDFTLDEARIELFLGR